MFNSKLEFKMQQQVMDLEKHVAVQTQFQDLLLLAQKVKDLKGLEKSKVLLGRKVWICLKHSTKEKMNMMILLVIIIKRNEDKCE